MYLLSKKSAREAGETEGGKMDTLTQSNGLKVRNYDWKRVRERRVGGGESS